MRRLLLCVLLSLPAVAHASDPVARDYLPNPALTPGAVRSVVVAELCHPRFTTKTVRKTTSAMKRRVYAAYGLADGANTGWCWNPAATREWEQGCGIDHLVGLQLGGADTIDNLWPVPHFGPWNKHMKDRVENEAKRRVCRLHEPLEEIQAQIAADWRVLYVRWFGLPSY